MSKVVRVDEDSNILILKAKGKYLEDNQRDISTQEIVSILIKKGFEVFKGEKAKC